MCECASVRPLAPRRARARARRVSRREPEGASFRVGQVIRHAQYAYQGVITGWDASCQSDALWIAQMGVDNLPSPPPNPRGCFYVGGGVPAWVPGMSAASLCRPARAAVPPACCAGQTGPLNAVWAHSGPGMLPQLPPERPCPLLGPTLHATQSSGLCSHRGGAAGCGRRSEPALLPRAGRHAQPALPGSRSSLPRDPGACDPRDDAHSFDSGPTAWINTCIQAMPRARSVEPGVLFARPEPEKLLHSAVAAQGDAPGRHARRAAKRRSVTGLLRRRRRTWRRITSGCSRATLEAPMQLSLTGTTTRLCSTHT